MAKEDLETPFGVLPVDVVDDPSEIVDDPEQELIVACVSATNDSPFTDNVKTNCRMCDAPIIHRPTIPKGGVPHCLSCALLLFEEEREETGETPKTFITRTTAEEVSKVFADKKKRRLS